jgi:uncharacterized coiled-coil DUF342 family protein
MNNHPKGKMTLPTTKPNDRDLAWYIEECVDLRKQLDREVESKNAHLRIACDEINQLKVRIGFFEREICRLRADKERMDWLEKARPIAWALGDLQRGEYWILTDIGEKHTEEAEEFSTLRAAIDAARKEAQP